MKEVAEVTSSWYESKMQYTYEIGMTGVIKNKEKCPIFILVPQVKVEKQVCWIS